MKLITETPRLIVREWTLDDAPARFEIFRHAEVVRFLGGTPKPMESVTEAVAHLERITNRYVEQGFSLYAVESKEPGDVRVIGQCGLAIVPDAMRPDPSATQEIEIAYHYHPSAWGKGYGLEAATAVLEYAHETLGMKRVIGLVVPENVASDKILSKVMTRCLGKARYYNLDVNLYESKKYCLA